MTRGRLRAAIAVLALALLGLLAWLLWPRTIPGLAPAESDSGASANKVSGSDTQGGPAPGDAAAAPAASIRRAGEPSPKDSGGEASPPARSLKGTCKLEDGTPLAGVRFTYVLSTDTNLLESAGPTSDVEGGFEVLADQFPSRDGRTLDQRTQVEHPFADLVSAEGAEILARPDGATTGARSLKLIAEPVRLVFRDRPGTAHVRLVSADTNEPVTNTAGLRVAYLLRGGSLSYRVLVDPGLGGWIPIPEGRLPEVGPDPEGRDRDVARLDVDVSMVEVEFAVPGFEKGRLPLKDIRGRVELRVRPVPPDATGEIVLSGDSDRDPSRQILDPTLGISSSLRWRGPPPFPSTDGVLGLPMKSGKFALYNLPDGEWYLEIAATTPDNGIVRGGKAFERHGSPVDLGKIELRKAGIVALQVVDLSGAGIPQAWAVVVRPEESPDQGRRIDLTEHGMASVGDLEPDVAHRVVVKGLPRDLEQTVVASAKPKTTLFQWPERLVPCRITLVVDGKVVANADGRKTIPAVVQESPLPRDKGAWGSDGTFEAKLVPGTYKFSALATPKEGGDMALFSGEVTVPAVDAFETRLELRREGR